MPNDSENVSPSYEIKLNEDEESSPAVFDPVNSSPSKLSKNKKKKKTNKTSKIVEQHVEIEP